MEATRDDHLSPADRRRRARRRRIADSALELFVERGYASTTTDEIAARADVSPRTFFNYVETKEDAIFPLSIDDVLAGVEQSTLVGAVGFVESASSILQRWSMTAGVLDVEHEWRRYRLIRSVPTLRARQTYRLDLAAQASTPALTERFGVDDATARLAARVFAACILEAQDIWVAGDFRPIGPILEDVLRRMFSLSDLFDG